MKSICTEREAKEFLAAEIAQEAVREGTPLSEIERKMLFFTEMGWTPPDMDQVAAVFHREYDDDQYERKIVKLIRKVRKRTKTGKGTAWSDAIKCLSQWDHYLLLMLDQAGEVKRRGKSFCVIAILAIAVAGYAIFRLLFSHYLGHQPNHDEEIFFVWLVAMACACGYLLRMLLFGRRTVERIIARTFDMLFGVRRK